MKKKRKIIILIFIAIISIIVIFSVVKSNIENNLKELINVSISDVDLSSVQNGNYPGSYKVFPIAVKVSVTVRDHKISSIELLEHKNGHGTPAEAILNKIIEAQTLKVDVISGATYSSVVILKAIENALSYSN